MVLPASWEGGSRFRTGDSIECPSGQACNSSGRPPVAVALAWCWVEESVAAALEKKDSRYSRYYQGDSRTTVFPPRSSLTKRCHAY